MLRLYYSTQVFPRPPRRHGARLAVDATHRTTRVAAEARPTRPVDGQAPARPPVRMQPPPFPREKILLLRGGQDRLWQAPASTLCLIALTHSVGGLLKAMSSPATPLQLSPQLSPERRQPAAAISAGRTAGRATWLACSAEAERRGGDGEESGKHHGRSHTRRDRDLRGKLLLT